MRDQQVNSFNGGMMKDLGATTSQGTTYTNGINIRIITDGDGGDNKSGVVVKVKGNEQKLSLRYYPPVIYNPTTQQPVSPAPIPLSIIGHTVLRDTLVLFSVGNNSSYIHSVDLTQSLLSSELIYSNAELGFDINYPIEAVGRYESENTQRIYWTDNLNPIRTLNIIDTEDITINDLNLAPSVTFSIPQIQTVNSTGSLLAGMYQYGYRLKTDEGAETRVSPLTGLVHIVHGTKSAYWDYSSDPENTAEYSEATPGEETNKAVLIKLSELDTDYNTVELIAIYKTSAHGIDSAYSVAERRISASGEVQLTHRSLATATPITIEEVTAFNTTPNKAKTIAAKDNRLFVSNYSTIASDLVFNARAYRYKRLDDSSNHPFLALGDASSSSVVGGVGDYKTYIDEDFDPLAPYATGDAPYPLTFEYSLEHNLNAINPFNLESSAYEEKYKYHKDGITIGGEGPNVSYRFIKKRLGGNTAGGMVPGELILTGSNVYPLQTTDWAPIPNSAPFVSGGFESGSASCEGGGGVNLGDYKDPKIAEKYKGYHREELYRVGIVLYDLQGNPGFVNWVGDIKFPTYNDYDHSKSAGLCNFTLSQVGGSHGGTYVKGETAHALNDISYYAEENFNGISAENLLSFLGESGEVEGFTDITLGSSHTNLFALGLEFTVNIPENLKPLVSGYSIVRCKREDFDKTVLGMGPVTFMHAQTEAGSSDQRYVLPIRNSYHSIGNQYNFYGGSVDNIFTIDSPDFAFTGNYPSNSPCSYIKIVGGFNGIRKSDFNGESRFDAQVGGIHTVKGLHYNGIECDIKFMSKLRRGEEFYPTSTEGVFFQTDNFKGIQNRSLYGTLGSNQLQSEEVKTSGIGEDTLVVGSSQGLNWHNFFESDTYSNLATIGAWNETGVNEKGRLIAAVKVRPSENQYGGNTYESRKSNTYISTGHYVDKNVTTSEVWGGDTYVTIYDLEKIKKHNGTDDPYVTVIDENKRRSVSLAVPVETSINTTLRSGYHFANKTDWDIDGEQQYNEFTLHSVYSSEVDTYTFIPKPLNFSETTRFDHRVSYSDSKIDGSTIDGWRKFKLENYKDVEGEYGSITKLLVYKDNMFFIQERGFGALSINPTSTVVDNDGTSIVLGTGDVIQNYKYYSTVVGGKDIDGAISTSKGIYWIDKKVKKIYAFRANGLESISDVHGLKAWTVENIQDTSVVVLGHDSINDEVLFSIEDKTLVFSEVLNKFTSTYTFGTSMFINTYDRLFSIGGTSNHILYEHNLGSKWYGTDIESEIEFIVNKHPLNTKVFDNLEWYTDGDDNKFEEAEFKISAGGGTSLDLTSQNVSNREKMSKMAVPRTSAGYRFRDTFMKVKLTTSKDFILHYVKTSFRISKR